MRNWQAIAKWTAGAVGALVLLLVLLLYTPPGLALVGRMVRPLSGGTVLIKELSGTSPGSLHVAGLEIADKQGTWLRATDVSLDWSFLSLLHNHVSIEHV